MGEVAFFLKDRFTAWECSWTWRWGFNHPQLVNQLQSFLSRKILPLWHWNALYIQLPLETVLEATVGIENCGQSWLEWYGPHHSSLVPSTVAFSLLLGLIQGTFKALYGLRPTYFEDHLLQYAPTHSLQSSSEALFPLSLPDEARWVVTQKRVFSVVGPQTCVWAGG